MHSGKLSKVAMAQRMATSRSQLDRVQGLANLAVQLDTLIKAANAVDTTVEIQLKRQLHPFPTIMLGFSHEYHHT